MLKGIGDSLKKVFGTKYDRDIKTMTPLVEQTNDFFESYKALSNDEWRNKTLEFRERIADYHKDVDVEILVLKQQATDHQDIIEKA